MNKAEDCFYVDSRPDYVRPEILLKETKTDDEVDSQTILCGYVPVVLMKMFGPLIFCDLRIRADAEKCEWIIERQGKDETWNEVARIPGQLDEDFQE